MRQLSIFQIEYLILNGLHRTAIRLDTYAAGASVSFTIPIISHKPNILLDGFLMSQNECKRYRIDVAYPTITVRYFRRKLEILNTGAFYEEKQN